MNIRLFFEVISLAAVSLVLLGGCAHHGGGGSKDSEDAYIALEDVGVQDMEPSDIGLPDASPFFMPDEGDEHDAEPIIRCTRDWDCVDETQVCFVGHCLEPCLEVPRGYNIIATVSSETDPFGMPVGDEFSYGTRLCIARMSAVVMNVLTPEGVMLASSLEVDNLGRNCGREGAANMRPLNRRLFQGGHVPEDWGMELECLGHAPGGTYMAWVRKILPPP